MSRLVILSLLLVGCLIADTKTEVDLRIKLAATEAALLQSNKDKAALTAKLGTSQQIKSIKAANEANAITTQQAVSDAKASADANAEASLSASQRLALATAHNTVVLAIIGAVAALLSPLLMAWLVDSNARRLKAADYARQDEVARRAEEVSQQAIKVAKLQTAQLTQIHTLVNSNLTAAIQDQLDMREINLVLLLEAVTLHQKLGVAPSSEALIVIKASKIKINELKAQLNDRLQSTVLAAKQLEVDIKEY